MELKLSNPQKEILNTLLVLHRKTGRLIKGKRIAKIVNRNEITIRNQMVVLRALGLVVGVPGPRGGYKPTAKAYEILHKDLITLPVIKNGELVDLIAKEVSLLPHKHQIKIETQGVIDLSLGDRLLLGPIGGLFIKGKVSLKDENILVLNIEALALICNTMTIVNEKTDVNQIIDVLNSEAHLIKNEEKIIGVLIPRYFVEDATKWIGPVALK